MRTFLMLIGILVIVLIVIGFYRGWFALSGATNSNQAQATLTVHPGKIASDKNKVFGNRSTSRPVMAPSTMTNTTPSTLPSNSNRTDGSVHASQ